MQQIANKTTELRKNSRTWADLCHNNSLERIGHDWNGKRWKSRRVVRRKMTMNVSVRRWINMLQQREKFFQMLFADETERIGSGIEGIRHFHRLISGRLIVKVNQIDQMFRLFVEINDGRIGVHADSVKLATVHHDDPREGVEILRSNRFDQFADFVVHRG